jgi:phytoene dehydrogenase-like protein
VAKPDVVIVGAGLAGLCCGRRLSQCGIPFLILEGSDGVGGRVRSDRVEGFTLNRGFQVYPTAYPECRRVLDLSALVLRPFARGVLVRFGGRFHRFADTRSTPGAAVTSFFDPVGAPADMLRVARLKWSLDQGDDDEQTTEDDHLALDFLRTRGFGPELIDRFFRPFFGGLFLDRELVTSSRYFRFVFRALVDGPLAVPAGGMQAIPDQIVGRLPSGSVRLGARVEAIAPGEVKVSSGESIRCRAVVLATDGTEAARLTRGVAIDPGWKGTVTIYYTAADSPVREPVIVLDGDGKGPVNTLAVMSEVAPEYVPNGQALIAVSVVGVPPESDVELDRRVREQMAEWYGPGTAVWRFLRAYRIPHALPDQTAGMLEPWQRPVRLYPGLYVCGDHRDNASIDGAMTSGNRAAQAVMEDLAAGLS